VKFPATQGFFTAFWMLPTADGNNGDCPAIDYSTDWVRFGVDWQPDHVAWYIDGVKCAQFDGDPGSEIEDGPMQIILNNMVDNNWIRDWDVATTDQTQTEEMDVDYIRVHQLMPR